MTMLDEKIPRLLIVGDVHGKLPNYVSLVSGYAYSLQVGDMGFDYEELEKLNPEHHKFIFGNHEFYPSFNKVPHNIGNYGFWENSKFPFGRIFFVRGGYSVDKDYRMPGRNWFPEEELSIKDFYDILDLYEKEKPDFVVTHEAPKSIVSWVGDPDFKNVESRTSSFLQNMLEIHRPAIWIFGHYHRSWDKTIDGTGFICLPELGVKSFLLRGSEE